jgi:hypothetical protein
MVPTSSRSTWPTTRGVEQLTGLRWRKRSVALAATVRSRVRCWLATACRLRALQSPTGSGRRLGGGAVRDSHLLIGFACRSRTDCKPRR